MAIRYWMGVVHRAHVRRAVALGIVQANHGSRPALERMQEADGIVCYSPKSDMDGEPLREFTAIGRIAGGPVFQADPSGGGYRPWRRRADFDPEAVDAPIRPLREVLDFSRGNPDWGYQLRRGMIEISKHDFEVIRQQMRPPSADDRGWLRPPRSVVH